MNWETWCLDTWTDLIIIIFFKFYFFAILQDSVIKTWNWPISRQRRRIIFELRGWIPCYPWDLNSALMEGQNGSKSHIWHTVIPPVKYHEWNFVQKISWNFQNFYEICGILKHVSKIHIQSLESIFRVLGGYFQSLLWSI